jgi:Ca2+:H+ antiporter
VLQLSLVVFAVLLFLVPAVPGFHGDPDRHSLALVTLPVAIVLLGVYVVVTFWNLRQHHAEEREEADEHAWSLKRSLVALAAATAVTALISEILVHSLDAFAHSAGLSEFFISFVIVAIVGNAAEHGGAVVIAHRGNLTLASEIAVSSSAQVALFVIPVVALLSFLVTPALPLTFRPIELIAMGGAAAGVAFAVRDGFSRRWEGGLLIAIYGGVALAAFLVGDR